MRLFLENPSLLTHPACAQAASRSLVENDGGTSFQGAMDSENSPR